ncbi:MAG TPA: hypothetical protein PLD27_07385 [bacterium]|nr:hypothetical protein [bacterium]HPQ18956.1 hypothetical protein [bacterium]
MNKKIKIKCLWCNKQFDFKKTINVNYANPIFEDEPLFVCSPEHSEKTIEFLEKARNYYNSTYLSLLIALFIYPFLAFVFKKYFLIITMFMSFDFGIGLLIFPFTTPHLIKKVGILKSILIAKTIAIIVILIGFSLLKKII